MELVGARQKHERAIELLEQLDDATREFVASAPYHLSIQPDAAPNEFTISVVDAAPIPAQLALLAGDAVHNLRATLEHAVWELAGNAASRDTGFPLAVSRNAWLQNASRQLAGLSEAAFTVVEAAQPYHLRELLEAGEMPDEHAPEGLGAVLLAVHRLDVLDKHRLLLRPSPLIRLRLSELVVGGVPAGQPDEDLWIRMRAGAPIIQFRLNDFASPPQIRNPTFTIFFGEEPPPRRWFWETEATMMTAGDLRAVGEEIRMLLNRLAAAV